MGRKGSSQDTAGSPREAGSEALPAGPAGEPDTQQDPDPQVNPALWIGLLSGTSCDAIDAALVEIRPGPIQLKLRAALEVPMPAHLRERIEVASTCSLAAREWVALDVELGERLAKAAAAVANCGGIALAEVEGIASHGQTIGHFPDSKHRGSLQLGSPHVLHARTGVQVIHDFRSADLAAGGQGAPLTPWMHAICLSSPRERRAVLNLGGFTNVTYLPGTDPRAAVGFDPGPGNALLDRAARFASQGREHCDRDGARAGSGRVVEAVVEELLRDPYFRRPPPKSTGHEYFGAEFFERARLGVQATGGNLDDLFSTLTELTVQSIVDAAKRFFPGCVDRWIVYGGGLANLELRARLERSLAPTPVESTAAYGFPHEALEAMAFALMGWCSLRGVPSNLPNVTGAERPMVLGSLTPPRAQS